MGLKTPGVVASLVTLALLAPGGRVWADTIDGNWCFADGRRLSIQGSDLVSPGGKRMTGDYDRHAFAYVVPAGEASAGATVFMILIDDDTVQLKVGAHPSALGEGEVWRRCSERLS